MESICAPQLYGSSVVVMNRPLVDGLGTPVVPTIFDFLPRVFIILCHRGGLVAEFVFL